LFARGHLPAGFVKQESIALEEFSDTEWGGRVYRDSYNGGLHASVEHAETDHWFHQAQFPMEHRPIELTTGAILNEYVERLII
jgi:hypothetical protein